MLESYTNLEDVAQQIKQILLQEGFKAVGFANAEFLSEESEYFKQWINSGFAADMAYLSKNFDKRFDPSVLLPGTKSVVVALLPYNIGEENKSSFKIARYAHIPDYHYIVKRRLLKVLEHFPEFTMPLQQVFCDSAPLAERSLAYRAGLGRYGKNSLLINNELGSYFVIGELLLPIELPYDIPLEGSPCVDCDKCVKSCPAGALSFKYSGVDARRCISYLTIEAKDNIVGNKVIAKTHSLFGCDMCQEVCPLNAGKTPNTTDKELTAMPYVKWRDKDWINMQKTDFAKISKASPLKRAGYDKIRKCIDFLSGKEN